MVQLWPGCLVANYPRLVSGLVHPSYKWINLLLIPPSNSYNWLNQEVISMAISGTDLLEVPIPYIRPKFQGISLQNIAILGSWNSH